MSDWERPPAPRDQPIDPVKVFGCLVLVILDAAIFGFLAMLLIRAI